MIEAADAEFVCVIDPVTISVSTVAAILALSLMLLLVLYKYRGEIKIILYMKFGCHPFDCSDDTDIVGKVRFLVHLEIINNISGFGDICDILRIWKQ